MRLFIAATIVVAAFVGVVLLISWLFPYGAGWLGACVAITCLYAAAFATWSLLGNQSVKKGRGRQDKSSDRHRLRDNLLYFAVGMAVVTLVLAMTVHDADRGIHRNFRGDWVVGFGSVCFALGYAAKAYWNFRKGWRLWISVFVLFLLFSAMTIPILSRMEKVPLLLMGPLANIEGVIAFIALDWLVARRSRSLIL
jgi:magnesium-transporting ATPase (P-type)